MTLSRLDCGIRLSDSSPKLHKMNLVAPVTGSLLEASPPAHGLRFEFKIIRLEQGPQSQLFCFAIISNVGKVVREGGRLPVPRHPPPARSARSWRAGLHWLPGELRFRSTGPDIPQ